MNELTANRRSMKSTYKNILDLMLPPSDGARACASSLSDCSRFSVYRLPSPSSMFLHHMRVVPTGTRLTQPGLQKASDAPPGGGFLPLHRPGFGASYMPMNPSIGSPKRFKVFERVDHASTFQFLGLQPSVASAQSCHAQN